MSGRDYWDNNGGENSRVQFGNGLEQENDPMRTEEQTLLCPSSRAELSSHRGFADTGMGPRSVTPISTVTEDILDGEDGRLAEEDRRSGM